MIIKAREGFSPISSAGSEILPPLVIAPLTRYLCDRRADPLRESLAQAERGCISCRVFSVISLSSLNCRSTFLCLFLLFIFSLFLVFPLFCWRPLLDFPFHLFIHFLSLPLLFFSFLLVLLLFLLLFFIFLLSYLFTFFPSSYFSLSFCSSFSFSSSPISTSPLSPFSFLFFLHYKFPISRLSLCLYSGTTRPCF